MSRTNAVAGAVIRAVRRSRGRTQTDVARALNASKHTLSRIERGDSLLTVADLLELSFVLEVPAARLIYAIDYMAADLYQEPDGPGSELWKVLLERAVERCLQDARVIV